MASRSAVKSMTKWGNRLVLLLNLALFAIAFWFICTRGLQPTSKEFSYQDLVTILLAAIAVILAAVTIFVALVALWGYTALKETAKTAAEKVARETAEETANLVVPAAARTLTMRELPGMVRLYFATEGTPQQTEDDGDLEEALKSRDRNAPDA